MCLHMKASFCTLVPKLLVERLNSIWSIYATQTFFLKETVGLHGISSIQSLSPILLQTYWNCARSLQIANSKLESADKDPDDLIMNLVALRQRIDEIGLVGNMSDMELIIHVLNKLPEEYDVVLDSLEACLVSTGEDRVALGVLREKLNARFERINSKESKKDCNKKALAAGYNDQLKRTCCKFGQYGHKSDWLKCPENKRIDGNKNQSRGNFNSHLNVSRCSNTKCWNYGKLVH